MEGKKLLDALSRIEAREWGFIWSDLPEIAGGEHWENEVLHCAGQVKEYLIERGNYLEETLLEFQGEYADSQVETYYHQIHKAVHNLSLWASPQLDTEVEYSDYEPSRILTEVERAYYYTASCILWRVVVRQAFSVARGEEK